MYRDDAQVVVEDATCGVRRMDVRNLRAGIEESSRIGSCDAEV